MSGRGFGLTILLGACAVAGGFHLLGVPLSDGSAYPEYSSLRSDPAGSKLLFDTLRLIPGTSVTRNYLPPEYIEGAGASLIFLALKPESLEIEQLVRLDKMATRGNRIVIGMAEVTEPPKNQGALAKIWKVRTGLDPQPSGEPQLIFTESTGWKIIRKDGIRPLAIERAVGKGSVIIVADSHPFGNAFLADANTSDFPLISAAIGPSSRIIFDEEHFGITQTGSVVGLVRRFRLTGMALGLAFCAALFVWRNLTAFPPPESSRAISNISGRASQSGLQTLLRRHVKASELASLCWNEWLTANRREISRGNAARAEDVIRSAEGEPVKAIREIQTLLQTLHSKGTL